MKQRIFTYLQLAVAVTMVPLLLSCGSSSGDGSTATISSLTQIPDVDTMASGGATSNSNITLPAKAVSGTPPLITAITDSTAKTYFWWTDADNNLVDQLIAAGVATEDDETNFWPMEGSCRMAQMVGYAMQNIKQAGTSACYMKNMPDVLGADSLTTADGATALSTPSEIFNKQASDFIVKVNVANATNPETGEPESQVVYIKIFGTSSLSDANDYNVDLWFCADTASSATGFETVRYDASAGTLTKSMQESSFGTFTSSFTAAVTTDSATGLPVFDSASDRVASNTFSGEFGGSTFIDKSEVRITDNLLYAKSYNIGDSYTNKNFAVAQYSGDAMSALRFIQAGYKGEGSGGEDDIFTYDGGTEYQTDHYAAIAVSALADSTLQDATNDYVMASDTFFDTAPTTPTIDTSDYDCNPTVSYTVAMDFSNSAVQAVATLCENNFQNMQFCDGTDITAAKAVLWSGGGQ